MALHNAVPRCTTVPRGTAWCIIYSGWGLWQVCVIAKSNHLQLNSLSFESILLTNPEAFFNTFSLQCKSRSDSYWVVGVHEKQQQIRCIQCKGAAFPPTLPRPSVTVLPLQLPLCDLTTEKGQMEVCKIDWFSNFMHTVLTKVVPDNLKACPRFVLT